MSELEKLNNRETLVVCFGGMAQKFGGIPPFEFLKFLSLEYGTNIDMIFYIDKYQCCYHKGIEGKTTNIEETVEYLRKKIEGKYKKIIFMGISAGGYASILFGSLCNIDIVIAYIPKTILDKPVNEKYKNLKNFINKTTKYIIIGDTNITNIKDSHHIKQCENLECFQNVVIKRLKKVNVKELRDNGTIKKILDENLHLPISRV